MVGMGRDHPFCGLMEPRLGPSKQYTLGLWRSGAMRSQASGQLRTARVVDPKSWIAREP